jgi:hypothetical protein
VPFHEWIYHRIHPTPQVEIRLRTWGGDLSSRDDEGGRLKSSAFKDWRMRKPQIFILKGLQMIARGRGAIATTTPGCDFKASAPRRACKNGPQSPRTSAPSATHFGVEYICDAKPRVVVAIAPRPGANFSDPSGIKKQRDKVQPSKALVLSHRPASWRFVKRHSIAPSRQFQRAVLAEGGVSELFDLVAEGVGDGEPQAVVRSSAEIEKTSGLETEAAA